jgi:hypothetical protein
MAVVIKSCIIWNITPCSPVEVNQHFEGTCHLYFLGSRVGQTKNQHKAGSKQIAYSSALKMEATCSSEMLVDFHRTTLL